MLSSILRGCVFQNEDFWPWKLIKRRFPETKFNSHSSSMGMAHKATYWLNQHKESPLDRYAPIMETHEPGRAEYSKIFLSCNQASLFWFSVQLQTWSFDFLSGWHMGKNILVKLMLIFGPLGSCEFHCAFNTSSLCISSLVAWLDEWLFPNPISS